MSPFGLSQRALFVIFVFFDICQWQTATGRYDTTEWVDIRLFSMLCAHYIFFYLLCLCTAVGELGFLLKSAAPEATRDAIEHAFNRPLSFAIKKETRFRKYIKPFINRIAAPGDPKTSRLAIKIGLFVFPVLVCTNLIWLPLTLNSILKLSVEGWRHLGARGRLLLLFGPVCIVNQVLTAIWTMCFAEEKFRAIIFDRLEGMIRLDIASAGHGGTDAAGARLQWWITGVLRDQPEWLEDCSSVEMQEV